MKQSLISNISSFEISFLIISILFCVLHILPTWQFRSNSVLYPSEFHKVFIQVPRQPIHGAFWYLLSLCNTYAHDYFNDFILSVVSVTFIIFIIQFMFSCPVSNYQSWSFPWCSHPFIPNILSVDVSTSQTFFFIFTFTVQVSTWKYSRVIFTGYIPFI